jgi:hypothetical protein
MRLGLEPTRMEELNDASLQGRLLALFTNITLGQPRTNTLAYQENLYTTAIKSFIKLSPGLNVIKHFTAVIY